MTRNAPAYDGCCILDVFHTASRLAVPCIQSRAVFVCASCSLRPTRPLELKFCVSNQKYPWLFRIPQF